MQVIIDHKTPAGFESIAQARRFLLNMGAKEMEDPETADWDIRGCHVVAPVSTQLWVLSRLPQRNCSVHMMVIARFSIQETVAWYADSNNGCSGQSLCARPNIQGSGMKISSTPTL
jgi:ribosomal protein RSM22 (predicted rRNA methylase)